MTSFIYRVSPLYSISVLVREPARLRSSSEAPRAEIELRFRRYRSRRRVSGVSQYLKVRNSNDQRPPPPNGGMRFYARSCRRISLANIYRGAARCRIPDGRRRNVPFRRDAAHTHGIFGGARQTPPTMHSYANAEKPYPRPGASNVSLTRFLRRDEVNLYMCTRAARTEVAIRCKFQQKVQHGSEFEELRGSRNDIYGLFILVVASNFHAQK